MSGTRSDQRRGTLGAALLVAVLIVLAHGGALLAGEGYYFRDLSQNHGPLFEAARALLADGEAPWWNPWSAGGKPLLANPNAILATPAGLIAVLLPAGLTASILFGAVLAPVFLVLLLRDLGRSAWASAAGGLAYGLSGFALSLGTLPNLMAASSWIPPALFFLRKAGERAVWTPVAAAACAFVLVPCEPVSALVLVVFACLPLSAGRPIAGSAGRSATVLALGAGAAAYQILPATAWILSSARGSGLPDAETGKWSLELLRLPELLAPGFLGDPSRLSSWWSAPIFETGYPLLLSLHVGVPVILLAVWGTMPSFCVKGRPAGSWADRAAPLAGLGFLVLACGGLVSFAMRWIPGGDLFRYPEKLILGAVLALAFQAALGVDRVLRTEDRTAAILGPEGTPAQVPARASPIVLMVGTAGTALVLLLASALAGPSLVGRWFALPESASAMRSEAAGGVRAALVLGAVEACLLLLSLLVVRRAPVQAHGGVVLAAIGASLLMGALVPGTSFTPWRVRANPSAPATSLEKEPFFANRLEALRRDGGRIYRYERPSGFAVRNRTGTLADLFVWERRALARSSASAFGAELVYDRSTDRMDPRGGEAARELFERRPLEVQKRFWDLASVRLVLSYAPLESPGLTLVDRLEGESLAPVLLYENEGALPRARLVRRSRLVSSDAAALEEIASGPGDRWRGEVLLADEGPPVQGSSMTLVDDRAQPGRRSVQDLPAILVPGRPDSRIPMLVSRRASGDDPSSAGEAAQGEPGEPGGPSEPGERVTILERRATRLRVAVDGVARDGSGVGPSSHPDEDRADAWLVVAENHVRGWRATVDEEPVAIHRANGMFMAIPIAAGGRHVVDLRFVPPGLYAGVALSALTMVFAAFLAFRGNA